MSSFQGLAEVIAKHGLPCSPYTDRGSHYFHTPKAGEQVDEAHLTQVGRALAQLGIAPIAACSPEARGRSERLFGTLQDRRVEELMLAGITTVEAANRFIEEVYLPDHDARFALMPEQPESALVADRAGVHRDILSIQETRVVGNDNTVRYRRLALQIPPSRWRPHFVKLRVRVHHDPDGTLAIVHGPRCLARYAADGSPLDHAHPLAARYRWTARAPGWAQPHALRPTHPPPQRSTHVLRTPVNLTCYRQSSAPRQVVHLGAFSLFIW